MPQPSALPQGRLVRVLGGGTNALKQLLLDLKKYSFSGYVRIEPRPGDDGPTGVVLVRDGNPEAAIRWNGEVAEEGRTALKRIWEDSYREACRLEIHAKVDVDALLAAFAEALLDKPRAARKVRVVADVGEPSVPLETSRKGGKGRPSRKKTPKKGRPKPALVIAPTDAARSAAKVEPATVQAALAARFRAPPEAEEPVDETTRLVAQYTFDTFVVGPSNRFAHAASLDVAEDPAKAYNPLFVTAGPGLGKTHLLNAIGNRVRRSQPKARVLYTTTEALANELREAKRARRLGDLRKRYRSLDLLLLDDAHFLGGQDDVQEEVFHTFNALHQAGKQIVLASDRPPKDIPELEDRLVSRFESGLLVDIQPPEPETRLAILRRRLAESDVELDDDVLEFVAAHVGSNVRTLQGALNRLLAHASLLDEPITSELAKTVLEEFMDLEEGTAAPPPSSAPGLVPGQSYLVEEERPDRCFRLVADVVASKGEALVVTRTNPNRMRARHGLEAARVLWLTDREGSSQETIPPSLERIIHEIEAFMEGAERGVVLLDGVEYLVSNTSFDGVLRFLRRVVDHVSETNHIFLVSLSPRTLKEQEGKILQREMERLTADGEASAP
jgi:chromosomal replication initiator protein DnaA